MTQNHSLTLKQRLTQRIQDTPIKVKLPLLTLSTLIVLVVVTILAVVNAIGQFEARVSTTRLSQENVLLAKRFGELEHGLEDVVHAITGDSNLIKALVNGDQATLQRTVDLHHLYHNLDHIALMDMEQNWRVNEQMSEIPDLNEHLVLALEGVDHTALQATPQGWLFWRAIPIQSASGIEGAISVGWLMKDAFLHNINFNRTDIILRLHDPNGDVIGSSLGAPNEVFDMGHGGGTHHSDQPDQHAHQEAAPSPSAASEPQQASHSHEADQHAHSEATPPPAVSSQQRQSEEGKSVNLALWEQALTSGEAIIDSQAPGVFRQVMYTPLIIDDNPPKAVYSIALSTAETQAVQTQLINQILIVLVVVSLCALLATFYLSQIFIVRPLAALNSAAEQLGAGHLEARLPFAGKNEIGRLTATFDRMTNQLRESFSNLKQRTAQLDHANQEITGLNERLKVENTRMEAELDIVRQLQQMVLPTDEELEQVEGLDIAIFMEPADEVGGDYVDVLQHNGQVKIGIGDVTGHGLESGVLMLMTQMGVRTLLTNEERDPNRFMSVLNRTIYNNVQRMKANKSLSLALLDYSEEQLTLSGQHEELIVVRKGGQIELIDTCNLGFPIGLDDDISDFVNKRTIPLQPGDGVVLYTDGITEAENIEEEQYELERLCQIVSQQWQKPAAAIKEAVIADLRSFIGQQKVHDDITLLVLKQK